MVMIEFDEGFLFKEYKLICKDCIKDGYALPYLLKVYPIPVMYSLKSGEKEQLFSRMGSSERENLYNMLKYRRSYP